MDTTPFHLILFALDIVVWGGLFLWFRRRRNNSPSRTAVYHFEKSFYAPTAVRKPSLVWDVTGILLFGGFGLACFAVLSRLIFTNFVQQRIYHFNVGQCIAEGIAIHGTLFLIVVAFLLHWNRRKVLAITFGCCAVFWAGLSLNMLYWEPYHAKVAHYEIKTKKRKKPLRIVFVADIQTDRIGFHEINTLKKIQQQKADVIILGGDYLQTFGSTRETQLPENFRQLFLDYPLTAPYGVYAISGNIGSVAGDRELFRETGVDFYSESVVWEDCGADKGLEPFHLVLLGLGDSCGGVGDDALKNADGEYSENFIVMAGHFPNYAIDGYTNPESGRSRSGYRNAERAPDLMLAGHTHGGQVVIPFYGPVPFGGDKYAQQVPRRMRGGFFPYPNGGHLLVTRGSGLERGWAARIRLFCPSEISVINIVPE